MKSLLLAALFLAFSPFAFAQPTSWPVALPSSAGEVRLYEPQIDGSSGNGFTAHAAASVTPPGGASPVFGAVFFTATIATDRGTGLVTVQSVAVTNGRFPTAAAGTVDAVTQALGQAGAQGTLTFSQSQYLGLVAVTAQEQAAAANLDNTPPQIWFATSPSVLVTIAGEPKLVAAPNSSILTVVNSPFFIALDPATKTYYLHGAGQWVSTADILQGPWTPAANVPDAVAALAIANAANSPDAANSANTPAAPAPAAGTPPPSILVATQPTELIQTTGPAEYGPIDNTNLLYVTNTDSDVLMDIDSQSLYVLLSGRWFTAGSQAGPWTFVAPAQLPADFARIPAGLPISGVRASVPGTQTARNAVLDAQIPQTAAVQRTAAGPKVAYDGAPKFEPVPGVATVGYAVNTTHAVVQVENTYYVCSDGVWFQGAAPVGPWAVSVAIPPVIYTIPPACPIYPVTYCRIYAVTPEVVTCGYLPGYTGSYVYGGTVVYGTGWPYSPWFGGVFIPRPVTWGFGASFNAGFGAWGFAIGGGWGAAAFGCSWHSGWWGTSNYHWNNWNWNSNWNRNVTVNRNVNVTNNVNVNHTVNNIYRNHPDRLTASERQRLDTNARHASTTSVSRTTADRTDVDRSDAGVHHSSTTVHQGPDGTHVAHSETTAHRNDVYADRDGNVYRHDGDSWQHRDGDAWRAPDHADYARNRTDLNRSFAARSSTSFHHESFHGGRR